MLLAAACGGKGETSSGAAANGGAAAGGRNTAAGAPSSEGPIGCANPVAYINESTGLVSCDGGFMRRPVQGNCPLHPPMNEVRPDLPSCQADTDCASIARGHCVYLPNIGLGCQSECAADNDCQPEQVCLCDSVFHRCVHSDCTTDADCGTALHCASYSDSCSPGVIGGLACQTHEDTCTTNAGCEELAYQFQVCAPSVAARDCLGAGACAGM